jgi:hypothetical protein
LASATGWTEDHILHHLPLSRGWAYYHTARLLAGERCRWPGEKTQTSTWIDKIRTWVTTRKN